VAGLIIVEHRRERGFMGELEGGGAATGVGEAVDFGFGWLAWVVIGFRRGGGGWHR
jgi:hypothetical protein